MYSSDEIKSFSPYFAALRAKKVKENQNSWGDRVVAHAMHNIVELSEPAFGFVPYQYISFYRNNILKMVAAVPDGYQRVADELNKFGWHITVDEDNKCFIVDMLYLADHSSEYENPYFSDDIPDGNPDDCEDCDDDDDSTFDDDYDD